MRSNRALLENGAPGGTPAVVGADGPPPFEVTLLGPVRIRDRNGVERSLATRKARALLGFLVLARGRPVSRGRLAAMLWERSGEVEARASLRGATAEIGRAFGDTPVLRADRDSLRADLSVLSVDVFALDDPEREGETLPEFGASPLMDGLENVGEVFSEWLVAEREVVAGRIRALHEAALERAADDPATAIAVAGRLVAFDPTHEGGWRALIRLHAEVGDRARALGEYERCRAALKRALEVEPSPETRELASKVRAGRGLVARPNPAFLPALARDPAPSRRARVGVLPFAATGPAETEALGLAYADEAALELARARHFDVIAPIALANLRGGGAEAVFRAHGLDYVVDGALRGRAGERALVLSLLDVSGLARPLWSDRIALDLAAVGEVEHEPLQALVARLSPAIAHIEGTRPDGTEAGDLVLRAIPLLNSLRTDSFAVAGELLAEAVVREPENANAAAWAAQWHMFQIGQGWARDPEATMGEAERLAALAISLDPESAEAHAIYGHVASFLQRDVDSGLYYLERSLELNPHHGPAWVLSALTQSYLGNPEESLRRLERYRRLTPFHPHDRILGNAFTIAHVFAGDYEEAITVGRRAVRATPDFTNGYKPLLAAMGNLRQRAEARPFLEALLKREPGFNVHDFIRGYPFRRGQDRDAYAEGLRLAGVPKG